MLSPRSEKKRMVDGTAICTFAPFHQAFGPESSSETDQKPGPRLESQDSQHQVRFPSAIPVIFTKPAAMDV